MLLVAERGSERQFAGCRLVDGPPADLVVVGGPDESWTLVLLDRALRALQGGARLIAMQDNAWWLSAGGPGLDSGAYVRALAHAAGVRPRVIGKPAAAIFRTRLPRAGLPPAACVMVGDDLRTTSWPRSARGCAASRAHRQGPQLRGRSARRAADAILDSVADSPGWIESPSGGCGA